MSIMTVDIEYELYEGCGNDGLDPAIIEEGCAKTDTGTAMTDEETAEDIDLADTGYARDKIEALLGIDTRDIIRKVADEALRQEGCPWEAMFDVLITGDEEIRAINSDNRGIDRPTDVLSFPMISFDVPGDFSICEDPAFEADYFNPDTGELMLGSIVLSVPRILAQASEYGHSVEREFAFLVAHSMFHLMGYDHMSEAEESVMKQKQYSVLDALGIVR